MLFVFLVLVPVVAYALSNWLVWQTLKKGTILPAGNLTQSKGQIIGFGIKFMYFAFLIYCMFYYHWIIILTLPFVWFFSGWLATIVERKIYMKSVLDIAKANIKEHGNSGIPDWWINLMPKDWKFEYYSYIESQIADKEE